MGKYTGDLLLVKKTVRITEQMEEQIEKFYGVDFSDKFRNMVDYCTDQIPTINQEYYTLNQEVDQLRRERIELIQDLQRLREYRQTMNEMAVAMDKLHHAFVGEMIDKQKQNIAAMVERDGFRPTPDVVEKLRLLNERTGKQHSLADICKAHKEQLYSGADELAQSYVSDIYKEFQYQEMAKQPPEPEAEL